MSPKRKHYVSTSLMAGHIVITVKIITLWIFWTNDRKIMNTFKMGLQCLQLVTTIVLLVVFVCVYVGAGDNRVNTLKNENYRWAGGIQNESTGHTETIIAQHIQMRVSGHIVDANCGIEDGLAGHI